MDASTRQNRRSIAGERRVKSRPFRLQSGTTMIAGLTAAIAPEPIPAAVRSQAIGAIVTTVFGALWTAIGTHFLKRLDWRAWLRIALFTVVLCGTAARQIRRSSLPAVSSASSSSTGFTPRMSRQFALILALEWIPILGAVIVLRKRRPDFILPAIALIVGLHFIPWPESSARRSITSPAAPWCCPH